MDLEGAADELYGSVPSHFVQRRQALVAAARGAGDRGLAQSIGALRKPSASAWLVNRLARDERESVDRLLALGAQLRTAQERLAGDDLRRLTQDGRAAVERLVEQAVATAGRAGQKPSAATLGEVEATLQAALADGAAGQAVRRGRLTTALAYSGFGPLPDRASPAPPKRPSASPNRSDEAAARAKARLDDRRRDHEAAQERHAEAEKRARGLEAALRVARAELAAAERALGQAERRLERARRGDGEVR